MTSLPGSLASLALASVLVASAVSPTQAADGSSERVAHGSAQTSTQTSNQASTRADRPEHLETLRVPATGATSAARGSALASAPDFQLPARRTAGFSMVGLTWAHGTGKDVRVEIRTHHDAGWSDWQPVEVDDSTVGREATAPVWVGEADGVAARVKAAGEPQDLRIALIDPGTRASDATATTSTTSASTAAAAGDGAPSYTPIPAMVSRSQWGAKAAKSCDSPRYGRVKGVTFHHTAGSNSYTSSQSASLVRGIQTFHMSSRGWCDIGYNFLVDKYGTIFEGRSGGAVYQVRGAHAGNYTVNTYTTGVSMMGNLDTAQPTEAMKSATVKLVGWRLGTNFAPAKGTYAAVGSKRLNRIAGHRDVYKAGIRPATSTACPGKYGAAWMSASGGLRDRVAAYTAKYSTPIKTAWTKLGIAKVGYPYVGEYPADGGRKMFFTEGDMYSYGALGAHVVSTAVRTEYSAWSNQKGALGWPTGDITAHASGKAFQRFQHGTIYRTVVGSTVRSFGLTTGVDTTYAELGGFDSRLGSPVSRVSTAGGVDTARFQHGRISYDRSTGQASVSYD